MGMLALGVAGGADYSLRATMAELLPDSEAHNGRPRNAIPGRIAATCATGG
jgi:hypothetical protein